MEKITRNEARQLLREFEVMETKIKCVKNMLSVCTVLSNKQSLLVKYDVKRHRKSYFTAKYKNAEFRKISI